MKGKKILIVDNDAISRKFLTHTLKEQGYLVCQAESGKEGLIFAWRDHPHVIIMDPGMPDLSGNVMIEKLRKDPRTAEVPIIALGSETDPNLIAAYKEKGFSEYFFKSGEAIAQLDEAIPRLLGIKLETKTKLVKNNSDGLLIVFLSAKGGTGTSTLCANTAMSIVKSEPQFSTVVVDMVLPIGSIAPIVGCTSQINLSTLTDLPESEITPEFLQKELPKPERWLFQLLSGSPDPEIANALQVKRIPHIIQTLLATYDYVLIDMGRALSRISMPILQAADLIVPIVGTDASTVSLTQTILGYFQTQGIQSNCIYPVLNRSVGLEGLTKNEAEKVLGTTIFTTMPYMSGNCTLANNQNLPLSYKFPRDTASMILKEMATNITKKARTMRSEQ